MSARRAADRLLTVFAAAGLLVVVLVLAGPLTGVRASYVRTGSMGPTIPAGSLVVTHRVPVEEVRRGDVVGVRAPSGAQVTHRVVARRGGTLLLKGDANRTPDPSPYLTRTADEVFLHLPHAGRLIDAATAPVGLVLLGLLGLTLLVLIARPGLLDGAERRRRTPETLTRSAALTLLVAVAVVGPRQAETASAAGWGDKTPATSTVVAYQVTPTTTTCGPLQVLRATLTWAPRADATGYVLHYGPNGALTDTVASTVTSKTIVVVGLGTFWVEVQHAYAGTTWTSVSSNKKNYVVLLDAAGTCLDP